MDSQYLIISIWLINIITQTTSLSFPMIITMGTHYEVGRDIGKTFRTHIEDYFKLDSTLHKILVPWHNTREGKQIYNGYLRVANESYPQYIEEMLGVAKGADVSFDEVFLMNIRMELMALLPDLDLPIPDTCSDVLINYPRQSNVMIGHNEDNDCLIGTRGYFVKAHIYNSRPRGKLLVKEERFTAYTYPGGLPGTAFGFNQAGLTFTVDAEYPKLVLQNHTVRDILTRAILSADTPEVVQNIIEDRGVGAAYGFSVNVGVLAGRDRPVSIWNLEVAPNVDELRSRVNTHQVLPGNLTTDSSYYHVNMYRREKIDQIPKRIISSKHRTKRIEELPVPRDKIGIFQILGDTNDLDYPLYRTYRPTDPECTIASALIDLKRCTMDVYKDNPKTTHGPVHTFKMPCSSRR